MTAARRRQQEAVLLEIGQRDQGDHEGGDDVAQGDQTEHHDGVQYHDDDADEALVASSGVGQRGWIIFSRYLSTGTARCTRAARRRAGKG